MKKYLLSLTTLALLLCEASFTGGGMAFANNAVNDTWDDGNFTYKVLVVAPSTSSPGKVSVKAKDGASISGAISLESQVSHKFTLFGSTYKYNVTEIEANGFKDKTSITAVTISSNITTIGSSAFSGCSNLDSIAWQATNCNDFASSSASPFYSIRTQIKKFSTGASITKIPAYLCYGMTNLEKVTVYISGGVNAIQTIGNSAFYNCSKATNMYALINNTYATSLTSIGTYAFYNCDKLTGSITLSSALTTIGNYAFDNCGGLTSITIPNSVTSLGTYAFRSCTSLASVTYQSTCHITTIGEYTFKGCTSLGSISIPSSVTSIGQYAFSECTGATSLSIPTSVTSIGNYAFNGCSNVTSSLTFGGSNSKLETIGNSAFQNCSKISSITIPKKVTSIGSSAFNGCAKASTLTFTSPSTVTTIGGSAFKGCEKLTTVTIPASVTTMTGIDVFWNCTSLKTVTFEAGSTLTTFGNYLFEDCTSLTSVTFPSNLTAIPAQTFHGCTALETLIIPSAVTSITNSAFTECSALKTIIAYPSTHPTLSGAVTSLTNFTPGNVRVAVFSNAAKLDYSGDTYWSAFDVDTKIEGSCGTSATYSLDLTDGTLTISGTGAMDTYSTSVNAPWYLYRDLISSVVVENGITGIGAYAFRYCENVTSVSIPASVTSIGSSAFDNCKGLASYSYAGTLAQWLDITFSGSSSNPMYYVKKCYVNGSSEITNLVIPDGRTSINAYAFYNCTGLTSVTLPASLTSVGTAAFSTCTNISNVDYKGDIDAWCSIAFEANTSNPAMYSRQLSINGTEQTDIYLSDELAQIKAYVFQNNDALTSISLKNTTTINSNALTGCNADLIVRGELTGTCGTGLIWSLLDGVLTVSYSSGTGVMSTYSTGSAPWYPYRKSITKVVIGEGVTTVGAYTLYQFTQTCGVFLPSTLTQLNNSAFYSSTGIAYIVSAASTPPTVIDGQSGPSSYSSSTFYNVPTSAIIYVPSGCETAYSTAVTSSHSTSDGWKRFNTFYPFTGTCGDTGNEANVTWVFDPSTSTLTISGSGAMYSSWANASSTPWAAYKTNIQSVVIESGVTSIGRYAFNGCSGLTSITIPASVTTFNTLSFSGCNGLTTVNFLGTANQWASCMFGSTTGNPAYYARSLYLNGALMTECTISVSVSSNAFNYNTSLTSVTLANGCTSVGSSAFSSCSNLSSLTISPSVTSFAGSAFSSCTKLDKAQDGSVNYLGSADQWAAIDFSGSSANPAYYSKSLKLNGSTLTNCTISADIKPYTFYRNLDLVSLALGANTKVVGGSAFYSCSALETITCTASTPLDSIAGSAFYDCTALREITLPASLRKVMGSAFSNDNALLASAGGSVDFLGTADQWASIDFASNTANPANLAQSLKLNGVTLENCTISVPVKENTFYNNKSLKSLTLNSGCTSIASGAFEDCSNIAGTLTIPSTMTAIGSSAFKECTSLTGLDLSAANSLQTIGASAFWQDAAIEGDLYIPATVTSVGGGAFNTMSEITAIYAMPATVPTGANQYTFGGFDTSIPFYVTSSAAASNYAAAQYWQEFTNVNYLGYCGAEDGGLNLIWTYNPTSHILTISGFGAMANFANIGSVPWSSFRSDISIINIESGVTTIGNYAFYGCNNASFTSISIPEGVTAIGNSAFNGCTHLASVTLPSTLGSIGSSAFFSNVLTSISIPNNVTSIGSTAFKGCSSLASISIGESSSLATISNGAFENCTSLGSITIPNSLTSISYEAFKGCSSLAAVNYGSAPTLATIGYSAFANCTSLTSIAIPESITTLTCNNGDHAYPIFSGCTSLISVVWNARNCGGFSRCGQYQEYAMPFESIKTQITSFAFGNNVQRVPAYVCHGMTNLASVTIPSSVTLIGDYAFDGCTGITSVTSNAVDAPSISSNSFPSSVKSSAPLTLVSCESKEDYLEDANWNFTTIYPNKVDFNLKEHGSAVSSQCVEESETPSVPSPAPSETGYTFGGWYDNEECTGEAFDFSSEITADLTLFAKWTIISYDVTFDLQGHGDAIDAQTIDHNGLVNQPDAPSAEYYTFGGWYKEAGCSNAWDFSEDKVTDDLILYAKWTRADLALSDNADNSDALTEYDDETTNVHLTRSIISASFNTICLPFAMTAAQVETYFGAECDIEELTKASFADGNLKLFFTKRTAIEAGKPYLIKPQADVANPTIADVTIDNTARPIVFEGVTFTGTFSPTVLANSEDLLFLGAGNTLYMSSGGTMKGMRGYFQLTTPQAQAAARRSARIVFHEEVATGIETVESQESKVESTKIMRDGQLLIIRDGKTYNAQGALIK